MIRASVISFYCVVNNIISSSFIIIVHVKTSIQHCTLLYTYCHCLVCLCVVAALSCHCFLVLPDKILFLCRCVLRLVR